MDGLVSCLDPFHCLPSCSKDQFCILGSSALVIAFDETAEPLDDCTLSPNAKYGCKGA